MCRPMRSCNARAKLLSAAPFFGRYVKACLTAFRRVDAMKPNALPMDLARVAVDHACRPTLSHGASGKREPSHSRNTSRTLRSVAQCL
jgi:hypothetical protein